MTSGFGSRTSANTSLSIAVEGESEIFKTPLYTWWNAPAPLQHAGVGARDLNREITVYPLPSSLLPSLPMAADAAILDIPPNPHPSVESQKCPR